MKKINETSKKYILNVYVYIYSLKRVKKTRQIL